MTRCSPARSTTQGSAKTLALRSTRRMKPVIMGGDPERAKEYFEKNLELTDKKFLLSYIYMAKYYATKVLDEELFDQYLQYVEETSLDILPEMKLLNQIAKQKAIRLLNKKEELF